MTSITTTPFLSPPPTTWPVCTRPCVSSTKLRNSIKTSSGSIQTTWTVRVQLHVRNCVSQIRTVSCKRALCSFINLQVIYVSERWLVTKGTSTKRPTGLKKLCRLIRYKLLVCGCKIFFCENPDLMRFLFGAGSPRRLVTHWKSSLSQAGMGAGSEEVWAYSETAVHSERHVLHAGSGERVAADSAPAHQRQRKGTSRVYVYPTNKWMKGCRGVAKCYPLTRRFYFCFFVDSLLLFWLRSFPPLFLKWTEMKKNIMSLIHYTLLFL